MARPSARLERDAQQTMFSNIVGILEDLVKANATKKDLLIGARCVRLGRGVGIPEETIADYVVILAGANKHETDFIAELGE